jgi:glycosyltransferase involved in cell wall biosynthesis
MPALTLVAPPDNAPASAPRIALPPVIISTSYNESSILNLARTAAEAGTLEAVFTAEAPSDGLRRLVALPHLRDGRLAATVARRARGVADLPEATVRSRLFVANLARVGVWVAGLRGPGPDGAMQLLFDAVVARDLARHRPGARPGGVLVGMHNSSLHSFLAARQRGMLTVYNHVNCDLEGLNARVRAAGARLGIRPHGLWPAWLLRRVRCERAVADYILVSSTHLRDDLIARGVPPGKLQVLPDGVDAGRFAPRVAGPIAAGGTGGLRVLFVGVVSLGKGIHDLDAALARCGPGVVASCEAIGGIVEPELVAQTGHIRYRGMVHHEEVARALREADVFVLPSLGDTMPRAVMEALAAGLPVITTREAGCDHVIRHGENGYIVPAGAPDAIAAILRDLAASPATRRAVGQAARRTVEALPWTRHGASFLDWLGNLPAPPVGPQSGRTRTVR